NLPDAVVAPADPLIQVWQAPQQDAVLQFWMPSTHPIFFDSVAAVLADHSSRHAAWLVLESTIITNQDHPPKSGERTYGWSQMAFLNFREDIAKADALQHWQDHHTQV